MSRRAPRNFGDVKHSGLEEEEVPRATVTQPDRPASAEAGAGGLTFSTRWSDEMMNRAKAAHLIDRINEPNSTPTAFNNWVATCVQMWARLSPSRRAQERERLELPPATQAGSRPRKFRLPEGAKSALEEAMRADEISGHREGRGTFVTHAVLHAANAAAGRNGGDLNVK